MWGNLTMNLITTEGELTQDTLNSIDVRHDSSVSENNNSDSDYVAQLVKLIAVVTRYPEDILTASADLENDLGIDSVKRGEILVAVRKHYGLAEDFQVAPDQFRTIGSAALMLAEKLSDIPLASLTQSPQESPIPIKQDQPLAIETPSIDSYIQVLTQIIGTVTRYPEDILTSTADLENDLGIDSVKRGEILVAVRKHYGLAEDFQVAPDQFRTIGSAALMLAEKLSDIPLASLTQSPQESPIPIKQDQPLAIETPSIDSYIQVLTQIIGTVTRYPEDILTSTADLENDLGIDSVKRGEILVAVRKHYDLAEDFQVAPDQFRTIESAASMLVDTVPNLNGLQQKVTNENPGQTEVKSVAVTEHAVTSPTFVDPTKNEKNYESELTEIFSRNEQKPFLGKVALITGSGRGIGKDIASSLARLGATVIVNAFHSRSEGEKTTEEILQAGGKANFIWGSVANADHRMTMFDEIERLYGGLDFFISNASNGLIGKFDEVTGEHWEKGFQTNLVGLHQCALRAASLMKHRGEGKIITLSTPVSNRYVADFSCMAALKASVESLTRSMAVEFEKYAVTVNCISAGAVYGDLIKKFPDSDAAIKYWEDKSLGKRLVYPQEICNFINFLLSGAANSINGSILVIDGGITIRL